MPARRNFATRATIANASWSRFSRSSRSRLSGFSSRGLRFLLMVAPGILASVSRILFLYHAAAGVTVSNFFWTEGMLLSANALAENETAAKGGRGGLGMGRRLLATFAAEAIVLGETRARRRIVGRDHRIVRRQAPLLPIFFRGHIVMGPQVALQRLEFLAVLETDDVVRRNGFPHRNRGLQLFDHGRRADRPEALQGHVHIRDQLGKIVDAKCVVADIGAHDLSAEIDEIVVRPRSSASLVSHLVSFF